MEGMKSSLLRLSASVFLLATMSVGGCACGGVADEDSARIAYLGIDQVIVRGLALGLDGFNAADSANIPAQAADGDESGTMDVTGQVDQGNSDNKGMRLDVALTDYSDGTIDDPETDEEEEYAIIYDTADGAPARLEMSMRNIPDGTLSGTFVGKVLMEGDLNGEVDISVSFDGLIESDGDGGTQREEGTTDVSGTATSAGGEFEIDTTI
jgi:hypothetical protein